VFIQSKPAAAATTLETKTHISGAG